MLPRCCRAYEAWRAGLEIEEAQALYELTCTNEQAAHCREQWQTKEKVDLYRAQSRLARAGDARLLQHLGKVLLGQDGPTIADPGIGDIVFLSAEEEPEPEKPIK